MKLLVIFDNLELSGTHRAALNLMHAASEAGMICHALVCMNDKLGLSNEDSRILWPNRSLGTSESFLTKVVKALAALGQAVRLARKADVVLAVCPPSTFIAWWAGLRSGTPVVGWVHYDLEGRKREAVGATSSVFRDWIQNRLYCNFMPRMRYLSFVSKATAASMARSRNMDALPAGWRVLPNIFQPPKSSGSTSAVARLRTVKSTGEPVFVFLGRLVRQKRWEDALEAAAALQNLGIAAQWIFLGDGPERQDFQAALAASPVRNRLHWLGSDPNALLVLAQADALVLTSLYEAWPTVILEAFDLGVPVVAYDCPSGPAEMLGPQERGWITPEDPRSLALALAELLSPSGAREAKRRSNAGRLFLEEHLPQRAMAAWIGYFESIVENRARPSRIEAL
jgi:glycosyltransferase involved in cell wall biosynthesis